MSSSGSALSPADSASHAAGSVLSPSDSASHTAGSILSPSDSASNAAGSVLSPSDSASRPSGSALSPSGSASRPSGSALSPSGSASRTSGSALSPSGSALSALSCHFTWSLSSSCATLIQVRDKLIDIVPEESTLWRGQNYNLQGFLQHTLGHSSEALSLLRLASEALRGPGLLVNYSDLAWLHHERGEHEQSQEYLSRVEALRRKYPTEGEHPEVLAEKAWTLMKFGCQQSLTAVDLFEAALGAEPERVEWRSSQVIALVNAQKHNPDTPDAQLLQKVRRAHEDDLENLYLCVLYLSLRGRCGDAVLEDISELEDRIMVRANSSYSGLKAVLRFYRQINHVDGAIVWAEEALDNHPDSRYVKRCAALCYKWRVLFHKDGTSQRRLVDRAISLYQEIVRLYPDSALVKEIDLADLYSKSERSKAEEMYRKLLQRDMEPPENQMLYNRYAKFLQYNLRNIPKCIQYHQKAILIEHESFFRQNSRNTIEGFRRDGWAEAQDTPESAALQELQCHFTWELKYSRAFLCLIRDQLEDLVPEESAPWRGQNYNLQGFLQHTLGHSSEALSLLRLASEALRGPGLLVNYSDLAWLHHERGEHEQSQEYLSRVEALRREYTTEGDPTEEEHPEVLAEKGWTVMELCHNHRLAARLFKKALESEERVEWRSCYALALLYSHNKHKNGDPENILQEMKRDIDQDLENLQLQAEYLNLRVQRERGQRGWSTRRGGRGSCTGEELRAEVATLASQLLQRPQTLLRDIKSVLELQRRAGCVDQAVALANSALSKRPDSRYLKACLAICLKWQVDQHGERANQELIEQVAVLLGEVASLYPESCLKTEINQANVYAKSNHSLAEAVRLYQDLLLRDLEPSCRQILYHNYAKFLIFDLQDPHASTKYHLKAAEISIKSCCRAKSIKVLKEVRAKCEPELRRDVEDFLEKIGEI